MNDDLLFDNKLREKVQTLKSESKTRLRKSLVEFEKGNLQKAEEHLKWLNIYMKISELIPAISEQSWTQKLRHHWVRKLFSAIIIMCIVFLWITPKSAEFVTFDILTKKISLKLNKELTIKNELDSENTFILKKLVKFDINGLNLHYPRDGQISKAEIRGNINTSTLTISKNAIIGLEKTGIGIRLYIKNGKIRGTLSSSKAKLLLYTDKGRIDKQIKPNIPIPENINFECEHSGKYSIVFDFAFQNDWKILDVEAKGNITFENEYPVDSGQFVSRIQSGDVRISENNLSLKRLERDRLRLLDVKSRRFFIEDSNNNIRAFFEGSARSISSGANDIDLTPTYLEFLHYNWHKHLILLYISIALVLGLIWKYRK